MPVTVRNYAGVNDAQAVGMHIAETYRKYHLDFASPDEQDKPLEPFRYAQSADPTQQEAIKNVLRTEMIRARRSPSPGYLVNVGGTLRAREPQAWFQSHAFYSYPLCCPFL